MTYTLFDATLALARRLGVTRSGTATGGSTTTLIDTSRLVQVDDYWNEGTVWVEDTTDGLAPKSEFSIVSDFVQSTKTATIGTLTAAIAAGDEYVIAGALYTLDELIEAINTVLARLEIPAVDTSSLTITSSTTEYTLPAAVVRGLLRRVYLQTDTGSGDNRWREVHDWTVKFGATGAQDTLIIPQFDSGYALRLDYITRHQRLRSAGDNVNEAIDLDALALHAAIEALNHRMSSERMSKYMPAQYNRFSQEAAIKPVVIAVIHEPTLFNEVE